MGTPAGRDRMARRRRYIGFLAAALNLPLWFIALPVFLLDALGC